MEIKRLIVGMVQTNCYIAVHPETKEAVIVDPGDVLIREVRQLGDDSDNNKNSSFGTRESVNKPALIAW